MLLELVNIRQANQLKFKPVAAQLIGLIILVRNSYIFVYPLKMNVFFVNQFTKQLWATLNDVNLIFKIF